MIDLGDNLESIDTQVVDRDILGYIFKLCRRMYDSCALDPCERIDSFNGFFGGGFFVVEDGEDLKEITTTEINPDTNEWYSIDEKAAEFDVMEIVGDFLMVVVISNNAGGNTYFIPEHFVSDIMAESFRLTNGEELCW